MDYTLKNSLVVKKIYVSIIILGGSFLIFLGIRKISLGFYQIWVLWVFILQLIEILVDLSSIIGSLCWYKNDVYKKLALRLAAGTVFLHAFRVLIFLVGRIGPWVDFDIRPDYMILQKDHWTLAGLYFAVLLSALSVIIVTLIWFLSLRSESKNKTSLDN